MATTVAVPATTPVSIAELKAYLRLDGGDEDVLLASLARTATSLCEAFTGSLLLKQSVREERKAGRTTPLTWRPVLLMEHVDVLQNGVARRLTADEYMVTMDGDGGARVATQRAPSDVVSIAYTAGLADSWNDVPEPLRHGITRLVAHFYTQRDASGDPSPPAAVAALWRPWRRMRLG